MPGSVGLTISGFTNVTDSSMRINYGVTVFSGTTPAITLFYGLTDGGTTPGSWDSSVALGNKVSGNYTFTFGGLSEERVYYVSLMSVNSGGTDWATTTNQGTLGHSVMPDARVGSPAGRIGSNTGQPWAETICKQSLPAAHFGQINIITPMYAVAQSTLFARTVSDGASNLSHSGIWTSTDPRTAAYSPATFPAPINGLFGGLIWSVSPGFGGTNPVTGQFWRLRKGTWKLRCNLQISPLMYNADPILGGVQGGPYTVNIVAVPYSTMAQRSTLDTNKIFKTFTIGPTANTVTDFVLKSTCFWNVYVNVSMLLAFNVPPSVTVAQVTLTCLRA